MNDRHADSCNSCDGFSDSPLPRNRPGLPSLAYRLATHGVFFERMRQCLSLQPELRQLTARTLEDPTIALLDAWAVTLDVLTFYQERFANEHYLRTAVERRSILELARAIGYELDPGVAASAALAFELETGAGAPASARIDTGLQVLSVPGQDERPQTFETVESLEARPEWNRIVALQHRVQDAGRGAPTLIFEGLDTRLALGDALLVVARGRRNDPTSAAWDLRFVTAVELDRPAGQTRIGWQSARRPGTSSLAPGDHPQVFALRRRAAPFGHNAPDWRAMPESLKLEYADVGRPDQLPGEWPRFALEVAEPQTLHLDAPYPKVVAGGWLVLHKPPHVELYRVTSAAASSQTDFTLTAQTRQVTLEGENFSSFEGFRRHTVVLAESEELPLALESIPAPVQGRRILVAGSVTGLEAGRRLLLRGVEAPGDGRRSLRDAAAVTEEVRLEALVPGVGINTLVLEQSLQRQYLRPTVEIFANVVPATHGETVTQVLGSGSGTAFNQRFDLHRSPLTYVSAATAGGAASTLEVRVNEVLWRPVPSFFAGQADDPTYIVRHGDDGETTVQTGDGIHGARLPTGNENVRATYRVGVGLAGEVAADTLTLLRTRPLGVRSVTNPRAAHGAADPESLADARANAPRTVLTLDRVVSRQDFEDFARAFAGIAKARADVVWLGERRQIQLTLAAAQGQAVTADSELAKNLRLALEGVKDPAQAFELAGYQPLPFEVAARLAVDGAYRRDDVFQAVRQRLSTAFDFQRRAFGQPVSASEIVAAMQRVEGVIAVDLDRLDLTSPARLPVDPGIRNREARGAPRARSAPPAFLHAEPARFAVDGEGRGVILPAQLLTLDRVRLTPLDLRSEEHR